MADNSSHAYDLELIMGNEGLPAKTKLAVCFSAGGSTTAEGQAETTQTMGAAAETLVPYLVFKTQSEAQAAGLAAYLTQEYEAAKTRAQAGPGYMEDALGFAIAMMSAFGNPDMVQFDISNHGVNAIIKVKIAEEYRGMAQGAIEMALQTFAPALERKSHLCFSVETAAGLDAVLNADTAIVEATKLFKIVLKGDVSVAASNALRSLVPLAEEQKLALDGLSAMFREAVIKLRFKDFDALPGDVKSKISCTNELAMAPMLLGMIGPDNRRIIKEAVQKGAQSVELVLLGDHTYLKVLMQFLGVENLLD